MFENSKYNLPPKTVGEMLEDQKAGKEVQKMQQAERTAELAKIASGSADSVQDGKAILEEKAGAGAGAGVQSEAKLRVIENENSKLKAENEALKQRDAQLLMEAEQKARTEETTGASEQNMALR